MDRNDVLAIKIECALAHSRAEARLLQQPSTTAPSAHPRGAFIIVWKRSFLYDEKEPAALTPPVPKYFISHRSSSALQQRGGKALLLRCGL